MWGEHSLLTQFHKDLFEYWPLPSLTANFGNQKCDQFSVKGSVMEKGMTWSLENCCGPWHCFVAPVVVRGSDLTVFVACYTVKWQLWHVPMFEKGKKWCMLRLASLSILVKTLKDMLMLPGWDSCIRFGWPGLDSRVVWSCQKLSHVWQSQSLTAPRQMCCW